VIGPLCGHLQFEITDLISGDKLSANLRQLLLRHFNKFQIG
jgi:hypothetical protein